MNVYVFGNEDMENDNMAFSVMQKLDGKISGVKFVIVKPNGDLPFANEDYVVIMDTVLGIDNVTLIK